MKKLKVILISIMFILIIAISILIIVNNNQSKVDNLDDVTFEELFSENDFPESLSEQEVLEDSVNLGELFD